MKKLMVMSAALALVAFACGDSVGGNGVASLESANAVPPAGGGEPATGGGTAPGEVDSEDALLAFTQCLRDQGLDVADPVVDADGNLRLGGRPGGAGENRQALQAAREACADILEGVSLGFRDFDRTAIEDSLVAYAACMRDNGYQMADPDFDSFGPGAGGGAGEGGGPFGAVDREDPSFITANTACEEILGSAFGPGGPGGGPGRRPDAAPDAGNGG